MSATLSNHIKILAIHEASRECVWLRSVIRHIREPCGFYLGLEAPTVVHEDNTACIVQLKDGYIKDGNSVEQCFEKIGYPDWYKGKKNKKGGKLAANVVFGPETPFDMGSENELQGEQSNPGLDLKLVAAVYQEVMKIMKGKSFASTSRATPGYGVAPGFMHHAGISFHVRTFALSSQSNIDRINEWIIVDPTLIDQIP
ncbi:hypothetical protein Tco_1266877 [Tanacetum coccineum]